MVVYSPTKLTFILSTIFIMYFLSVFGAPLDNVQNVTIEIESGNETLIVGEKVQHEDRHSNDTSSNEKHNNQDDENSEEYYDDDYDVEGGDSELEVDSSSNDDSQNISNENAFSVENAFHDDIGFQDNPDYIIQSYGKGYKSIALRNRSIIKLCKTCSGFLKRKHKLRLNISLNITS